jgi:tagatose-6-phosphate ketose/aldose isomerase
LISYIFFYFLSISVIFRLKGFLHSSQTLMSSQFLAEPEWLRVLSERQPLAAEMLSRSAEEQHRLGYFHTLREICQQPSTWLRTSELMRSQAGRVRESLSGVVSLTLTGSGSSEYAGDCVRLTLQTELGIATQVIGGGALLTHGKTVLAPGRPGLMVSIARSGDSPESGGVLALMLKTEPAIRHLILTCNRTGRLARIYSADPRALLISLDESTNDQGLVMTSSFTNLALAARFLGLVGEVERYRTICEELSRIASSLMQDHLGTLAEIAKARFSRVLFLGSGSRLGAARESALKMLETTAGRVGTMYETYLGLRHGPLSYIHADTLVVCFLSSDPVLGAYEADLLRELDQKELGLLKVLVGERVAADLVREEDVVLECKGLEQLGDENFPVIDVIVGQLLAFFRCLEEGLRPDSPSEGGVINRVVQTFALHQSR